MGTNYYWKPEGQDKGIHIGKSSGGWCFALHVTDELTSLEDWKKEWEKPGHIQNDEYGERVTPEQMLEIITNRSWTRKNVPYGYASMEQFYAFNHAVPGPNGLARSEIDGCRCISRRTP